MGGGFMTDNHFDAIILAGGLGTRLRSVVADRPKCMAPVHGVPFLYYLLKSLSRHPVRKVVLSVGYLHEMISDWIETQREEFPFEIAFAVEETPLGTGGGIRLAMRQCKSKTVCVMNGDTFFNVNLDGLFQVHEQHDFPVTVAMKHLMDFDRYGTVTLDDHGVVKAFNEKAFCADGFINAGVYALDNDGLLESYPDKFSFENDFLHLMAAEGKVQGFVSEGFFIDIGIPEDYAKANADYINFKV